MLTIFYTFIGLFIPCLLLGTLLYLLVVLCLWFTKKRQYFTFKRCLIEFTFCCYLIALANLTGLFNIRLSYFLSFHATPNLIPILNTLREVFEYGPYVLKQVLLNVALYVPFGILVSLLLRKPTLLQLLLLAGCTSLLIETLQYFGGRFADIDDLLSNIIGALLGYLLIKLIKKAID